MNDQTPTDADIDAAIADLNARHARVDAAFQRYDEVTAASHAELEQLRQTTTTGPIVPDHIRAAIHAGHIGQVVIYCDGCGTEDAADYTGATREDRFAAARRHLAETKGWTITPETDLCPTCTHRTPAAGPDDAGDAAPAGPVAVDTEARRLSGRAWDRMDTEQQDAARATARQQLTLAAYPGLVADLEQARAELAKAVRERDSLARRCALRYEEGVRLTADRDRLTDALADCVTKATDYGTQDGGFVAHYLLPTGPIHRAIPLLQELGITVRPGFDGRTDATPPPASVPPARAQEHDWSPAGGSPWPSCRLCGIVQRRDGQHGPCRGPVSVELRTEPTSPPCPGDPWCRDGHRCDQHRSKAGQEADR